MGFMSDGEYYSDKWFVEMFRLMKGVPSMSRIGSNFGNLVLGLAWVENVESFQNWSFRIEISIFGGPFSDANIDFNWFKNFEHFHLYNSGERKLIDEISLPDSLEMLIWTCYELNSIDRVAFLYTKPLHLEAHDIDSLYGVTFPKILVELNLQYSRIRYLQGEAFPSILKRLKARIIEIIDLSMDMHRNLLELETLRLASPETNELICTMPISFQSLHLYSLGPSIFNKLGVDFSALEIRML